MKPLQWTRRRFLRSLGIATAALGAPMTMVRTLDPKLARKANRPLESHPGLDTTPGVLVTRDGTRLRTITTQPAGVSKRMPAILFVQWLSDSSIELAENANDGWSRMIRRVVRESGMVVMRTDKRGVGDSEGGPCSRLDYVTELSDHQDAFDQLAKSESVDPRRIVIFGASMGGNFAPLVALGRQVAGVIVWGGGARTWFERTLAFERNRRELSGASAERINPEMREVSAFLHHYLIEAKARAQIAGEHPALAQVWKSLTGTEGDTHYGRPLAFHQQAQRQDWTAAWARLDAPALILFGEYDWFEDAGGHALIERIVRRKHPEHTRFRIVPQTDHHFTRFRRPEDAVTDTGGETNEGPAVAEILTWLREIMG
jgi:pimeloyl-ACP methyl ester carboxylesterase